MKLNSIHIKNFQSIGEIKHDFFTNQLTLIDGYNYDLNSNNGAGKSAFLNAISYALYGKLPKNVNLSELIKDGESDLYTEISLTIENDSINIIRNRTATSGKVKLTINNERITGTSKQIEKQIEQLMGFTFDQFIQVVYIFQNSPNRFISLNDTEKKKFLSTIFNLEIFDELYKKVHAQVNEIELELSKSTGMLDVMTSRRAELSNKQGELRKTIEDYNKSKNEIQTLYDNKINALQDEISSLQLQSNVNNNDILTALDAERNEIDLKRINIASLKDNIAHIDKTLSIKGMELKSINNKIETLQESKCPTCSKPWDNAQEMLKVETDKSLFLSDKIKELTNDLGSYNKRLLSLNESGIQSEYNDIIRKMATEKNKKNEQLTLIKLKQQEMNGIKSEMDKFNIKLNASEQQLKEIETEFNKLESNISIMNQKQSQFKQERAYSLELKKIFSPTGLKAYIFDGIISQINERIDRYLNILTGGLFKFKLISDCEKGKFIEELTYSNSPRSLNMLSGGEYRRLSLALDISLSDVICSRMMKMPNILFIDEAFHGLDVSGRETVMQLLQDLINFKDSIYVVDHASEMKSLFAHTLKLIKKNNTTMEDL